jgi:hypothetical protein
VRYLHCRSTINAEEHPSCSSNPLGFHFKNIRLTKHVPGGALSVARRRTSRLRMVSLPFFQFDQASGADRRGLLTIFGPRDAMKR